jgi:hypothetical protein
LSHVVELVVFVSGFAIGLAVGRWWALLAPAVLGAYVALESEVEVQRRYSASAMPRSERSASSSVSC